VRGDDFKDEATDLRDHLSPNVRGEFESYARGERFCQFGLSGLHQVTVVASFYSSIAYSLGALAVKTRFLERIREFLFREPEPEVIGPEEAAVIVIADEYVEEPLHER
jgi:hypothetical protein